MLNSIKITENKIINVTVRNTLSETCIQCLNICNDQKTNAYPMHFLNTKNVSCLMIKKDIN